ncbi:hypothetical protein C3489_24950, partial [Streptomyces sp. Ru71]|uniref:DUF2510 domain-containing protein n=1 Tax=Streptomyces sp. Ru71 TaxID=2080746 RepID=UPI000D4C48F9
MSAPTPAPGDDRPREGYYPDPSIPGYVRYWNGAAWIPGTSRPAPTDGEQLPPPPGAHPATAPAAVEETGPHFFDEDPQPEANPAADQGGSAPAGAGQGGAVQGPVAGGAGQGAPGGPVQGPVGSAPGPSASGAAPQGGWPQPASAWGADRSQQSGFGGDQDRRVSWGAAPGTDPRVPAERRTYSPADAAPGAAAGSGDVPSDGTFVFRRPTGGADAGKGAAGTPGAPAGGAGGRAGAGRGRDSDEGTMTFRAVPPRAGTASAPGGAAPQGPQAPQGAQTTPSAQGPQAPLPGSQQAAPTATPGAQAATPGAQAGPQAAAPGAPASATAAPPGVPHQAAAPQPAPVASAPPLHAPHHRPRWRSGLLGPAGAPAGRG